MPRSSTIAATASMKPLPANAAARASSASGKPAAPTPAKPAPAAAAATPAKAVASRASPPPSSVISPSLAAAMGSVPKASVATAATLPASTNASPPLAATSSAGGFVTSGGRVTVDIAASDSGYQNQIYWSSDNFATRHLLGVDNHQASIDLGEFAAGTRIDFGIVNGANQFFRTGGSTANGDGVDHARITSNAKGTQIGFEDLHGGGDRDFNDAIIQIRSAPALLASVAAAAALKPEAKGQLGLAPVALKAASLPASIATPTVAAHKNDNRSGLGDGTNPGQGAGTAKSPNTGTLNPSQTTSPKPTVAPLASVAKFESMAAAKPAQVKSAATAVAAAPHPVGKKSTHSAAPVQVQPTHAKLEATKQLLASSYSALAPTPNAYAGPPALASEKAKVGKAA